MKSETDRYTPIGQLTDFIILLFLFSALAFAVFFINGLLYGASEGLCVLKIETEPIPDIHLGKLAEGDVVYDTVTKRSLGKITDLSEIKDGAFIRYRFTLEAASEPRAKALRTRRLWFYFKRIDAK